MDVGFESAGITPVYANDIDSDACASYRLNHKAEMLEGDVRNFYDLFMTQKGIDFVFGGPPCQGFSVAGKMDPKDARNQLIETFVEIVQLVNPKVFICENVKALAVLAKWKSTRDSLFKKIEKNYSFGLIILNSKDYGVPQNRERMFFIGVNKDILNISREEVEYKILNELSQMKKNGPTVRSIVKRIGPAGSKENIRTCKAKITFAKYPVLRRSPYAGMLFNGAGRPLPPDGHSSTLPASMGGNKTPIIDEGVIFNNQESFIENYHAHLISGGKPYKGEAPDYLRRVTIDECLAIQTFPPCYAFHGKQSAVYRQIGNAVPCSLAESVARACLNFLGNYI